MGIQTKRGNAVRVGNAVRLGTALPALSTRVWGGEMEETEFGLLG